MGGFHAHVNANTHPSLSSNSETLSGPLSLSPDACSQCNTTHNAGPLLSFNKQIYKKPNSINKKLLKYEPTNHNSFRLSPLSKIISMCIQLFQKTGETDGFLLNTLGVNGRLLYTSKYLLCNLVFLVLLEWVHPTTYGHYLWPEFLCWHKLQCCAEGNKQT